MKPVLLIDFGSTYTKLTAVDLDAETLLGTSSAFTTIETDIGEGLAEAMSALEEKTGHLDFSARYACSSAAGGLKMVAIGLVPELTAEAAKQASLGAGAKLAGLYSFELTEEDIEEIDETEPDIVLLVGGTDGGNSKCIIHNAGMLAASKRNFPIVIAGNRSAASKCASLLSEKETFICENVMPKFGKLNIKPAQDRIREIFLRRIIKAKGLSKASTLLDGIMMPTPAAVMDAVELLSKGCKDEAGIGELVAVDVGGATTDVYSVADGLPKDVQTVFKGLPEPYVKRTVEGDIGMRYSAAGVVEAVGLPKLSELSNLKDEKFMEILHFIEEHKDALPKSKEMKAVEFALASGAAETAVTRHCGTLEEVYGPMGLLYMQTGKDLREIKRMIFTGGSLINADRIEEIASSTFYSEEDPMSLRPYDAEIWVDSKYILSAMGLLAATESAAALRIMKKEFKRYGNSQ